MNLFAALLLAQLLGAGNTNVTVLSNIHYEPRWDRTFVRETDQGIRGDKGTVGSAAASQATTQILSNSYEISEAALGAIQTSMQKVYAVTNQMASYAFGVGFSIAPAANTPDLVGYTVKTTSNGFTDTQYVWYSVDLLKPPDRYVTYELSGSALYTAVKCNWQTPFTNKVTVTEGGVTWTGCHVCTVARPAWACGFPAIDKKPNEVFGHGVDGFDFGDLNITVSNLTTLTGIVTNKLDSTKWIRFDHGFAKEKSW